MENLEFTVIDNPTFLTRSFFKNNKINQLKIEYCNQGIDWSKINKERDVVRKDRLIHHQNHRTNPATIEELTLKQNFNSIVKNDIFYQYKEFNKEVPIELQHFQLRKNLKLLNNKELVYIRSHGIEKMNLITRKKQFLFIFEGQDIEFESKISCFDITEAENGDYLICCGRCDGQIVFVVIKQADLKSKAVINEKSRNIFNFQSKFTVMRKLIAPSPNNNEIINHVEFHEKGKKIVICSNDSRIRVFNIEANFTLIEEYISVAATNHCSFSFDGSILAGYGDFEQIELFDPKTQKKICNVSGHYDYGFVVKFAHNNNFLIASGNQDQCCKLWDLRKSINSKEKDSSLKTMCGRIEAIGDLMFSKDNEFIIFAENLDFLNIYDIKKDTMQRLSYFGSTCGIAFNPINDNIYASVSDSTYHGIMVYDKILPYKTSLYKDY
jgi:WD40 repeat protein